MQVTGRDHPFNYAYEVQCRHDAKAIAEAYKWTAETYGSNKSQPKVFVVHHEHMQRAARNAQYHPNITGDVFGWYSQKYNTVFISDKVHPGRRQVHAAVLVHEFVHYMQGHESANIQELEAEADKYMEDFMRV
jgi:hypothetical protein